MYFTKNQIRAVVFSAKPAPEFLLGVRLVVDKYTNVLSAKVYDEATFRYAGTGYTGAVAFERYRQQGGTWEDAITWLTAWLSRMGYAIDQVVISGQGDNEAPFNAFKNSFSDYQFGDGQDAAVLALHGWFELDYRRRRIAGESLDDYSLEWARESKKFSRPAWQKFVKWVDMQTRS